MQITISPDFLMYWYAVSTWLTTAGAILQSKKLDAIREGRDPNKAIGNWKIDWLAAPIFVLLWGGGGVLVSAIWQQF